MSSDFTSSGLMRPWYRVKLRSRTWEKLSTRALASSTNALAAGLRGIPPSGAAAGAGGFGVGLSGARRTNVPLCCSPCEMGAVRVFMPHLHSAAMRRQSSRIPEKPLIGSVPFSGVADAPGPGASSSVNDPSRVIACKEQVKYRSGGILPHVRLILGDLLVAAQRALPAPAKGTEPQRFLPFGAFFPFPAEAGFLAGSATRFRAVSRRRSLWPATVPVSSTRICHSKALDALHRF